MAVAYLAGKTFALALSLPFLFFFIVVSKKSAANNTRLKPDSRLMKISISQNSEQFVISIRSPRAGKRLLAKKSEIEVDNSFLSSFVCRRLSFLVVFYRLDVRSLLLFGFNDCFLTSTTELSALLPAVRRRAISLLFRRQSSEISFS